MLPSWMTAEQEKHGQSPELRYYLIQGKTGENTKDFFTLHIFTLLVISVFKMLRDPASVHAEFGGSVDVFVF